QHADRSQVLFHRWAGKNGAKVFDVRGDQKWVEVMQLALLVGAPDAKPKHCPAVRFASVLVADIRGEEFNEAPPCFLACVNEQGGDTVNADARELTGLRDDGLIGHS